jgi:hypothetical protein
VSLFGGERNFHDPGPCYCNVTQAAIDWSGNKHKLPLCPVSFPLGGLALDGRKEKKPNNKPNVG